MMDSTFQIKKHSWHGLDLAATLPCLLWVWRTRQIPLGRLNLGFWIIALDPQFMSCYDLLEIWFIGSSLNQVISNCSMMFLLLWQQKPQNKFATTHFMPRSCVKISDIVVFGIPRSASSSHTAGGWSLLIAACTCSACSGVLTFAGLPERGSLSTDSWPSLKCLCHTFICTALIASSLKAFWIIQIVSMEECSSLTQNLMQIHCSVHSGILNVMATQYTGSLNGVYCPHWLAQWSHHCSHMHIPVHSPWLPRYINVTQTILIKLTVSGFFWTDLVNLKKLSTIS